MRREMFKIIFHLSKKQPWLDEVVDPLNSLLFDECQDNEERELILNLIERFTYIEDNKFREYLKSMANDIIKIPGLDFDSTQIVGIAGDSNSDSSQYILYGLKSILSKLNCSITKFETNFQKACGNCQKNNLSTIILVDEFVGTGQTVLGRIKKIKEQFVQVKMDEHCYKIHVTSLVATEQSVEFLKERGIDINVQILLKKGIDDYHSNSEAQKLKERMINLENRCLSKKYNNTNMPSLGYGQAQAVYYRQDINVPNSVFPIFWWNKNANNQNRNVLIHRNMEDA